MSKTKKTKTSTPLDRIAAQLSTMLRRATKDVIVIGELLIESRKLLEHGEWQDWLAENFDLGYHTALNYMSAAEYVARKSKGKSETVPLFDNLSPTVLYRLAAGHCTAKEEEAILAATLKGRVDQTRASAICDELAPPTSDDDADDADDSDEADGADGADGGDGVEEDAEIEAILDGPPPAVPPPTPIPPPSDFALEDFDEAIGTLKRLRTKPLAQFVSSTHSGFDLENVADFIDDVMKAKAATSRSDEP